LFWFRENTFRAMFKSLVTVVALVLGVACWCWAQPPLDKITNLPGTNATVPFSMYSGYIGISNGKQMHYWFVESQNAPATDPLVLWLNGGPGCSSLLGLLSENGPFYPDAKGNLISNPYSWNKLANMLYLESPAGVGFSYCTTCPTFNDNITAHDNYEVLTNWFLKFPIYQTNPFYISGESYAGHYIPTLAYAIYQAKLVDPLKPPQSIFKGFIVGNPSTYHTADDGDSLTQYFQSHGIIPLDDNRQSDVTGTFDRYDILADVCEANRMYKYIRFPSWINHHLGFKETNKRYVPNPDPCIDDYVATYLNTPTVQNAIHVRSTQWQECGGPNYEYNQGSMYPYYNTFIQSTNWKIWVYSGDADTVINFIGTESWIYNLNRPVSKKWYPWNYARDGSSVQLAGWRVDFDRITFTTIKGAGHMVPWTQPAPAFAMFKSFLQA